MRIGVDASLLIGPMNGIGRYTRELLLRMIESEHEWYLYFNAAPTDFLGFEHRNNVRLRITNGPFRLPRVLWAQSILPLHVSRDHVEVFWSPTHRLPYLLPAHISQIVTIHDLVWRHAAGTMRLANRILDTVFMPAAVSQADQIITVSEHTAQDIKDEFPDTAAKVFPIHLGASLSHQDSTLPHGIVEGPYFLFVGTLEPRKNLARLIEAFSRLPNESRSVSLVIVGGQGWGDVDANSIAQKFGVQNNVQVLGYVDDELLSSLYANAIFLAMPSLYEGFGLPLVEAMIRGTPVLTSNVASMPEIAGKAGIFVDPFDISSITEGLKLLIESRAMRKQLSDCARLASQRFSWDAAAEKTLQLFGKAVQARKQPK